MLFRVEAANGDLVVSGPLDRESSREGDRHRLVILAIDSGSPPRTASLQVTVTMLDVNDNAPVIQLPSDPSNSASQSSEIDKYGFILEADRLGESDTENLGAGERWHLSRPSGLQRAAAASTHHDSDTDQATGDIETGAWWSKTGRKVVWPPGQPPPGLHVGVSTESASATLNPSLLQAFLSRHSDARVRENRPPGTVVTTVWVHDPDAGENGTLACRLDGEIVMLTPESRTALHAVSNDNATQSANRDSGRDETSLAARLEAFGADNVLMFRVEGLDDEGESRRFRDNGEINFGQRGAKLRGPGNRKTLQIVTTKASQRHTHFIVSSSMQFCSSLSSANM
ncbi:unnamed protein product [Protopolystoma xenopodis]|uniref:Cadherin domain-containing protein n=1 Tax=Protopolystoma xenopodis TaxID=117903 RepID=A0A3S4ZS30_9PLAT|nr:unnamed protein product [Protopolystoma xenopodis]